MLGGAGLGDIGRHFPSSDPQYKGIDSMELLGSADELASAAGWRVTYVDATIIVQKPSLSPFVKQMELALSTRLHLTVDSINVKAKTTDGLGFTGRGEGIAAMVVATLESIE